MASNHSTLDEKLARVRLLAMDVDGVLTDGGVYVLDNGEEFRRFHIKDGLGLKRVMAAGIRVAWISNGGCPAVLHRANRLGVEHVFTGVEDKLGCLQELCAKLDIPVESAAFIGDDLTDRQVQGAAGVAIAPADAVPAIRQAADWVTTLPGGQGAVREVCDRLLEAVEKTGNRG